VLGERAARAVLGATALVLAAGLGTAAVLRAPSLLPVAAVMGTGALAVALLANSRLSRGDRSRERRPYRAFMATQYAVCGVVIILAISGQLPPGL
jgi:hypothetical protein